MIGTIFIWSATSAAMFSPKAKQDSKIALGMLIQNSAFYYRSRLRLATPFCAYWGVICWYSYNGVFKEILYISSFVSWRILQC